MQQAGQVPYLDQNDAYEQSLGQSDGSLPGSEQTLNQSINLLKYAGKQSAIISVQAVEVSNWGLRCWRHEHHLQLCGSWVLVLSSLAKVVLVDPGLQLNW